MGDPVVEQSLQGRPLWNSGARDLSLLWDDQVRHRVCSPDPGAFLVPQLKNGWGWKSIGPTCRIPAVIAGETIRAESTAMPRWAVPTWTLAAACSVWPIANWA